MQNHSVVWRLLPGKAECKLLCAKHIRRACKVGPFSFLLCLSTCTINGRDAEIKAGMRGSLRARQSGLSPQNAL